MGGIIPGKGLGKNNQGIAAPLEITMRKNKACLDGSDQPKAKPAHDIIPTQQQKLESQEQKNKQKIDQEDQNFMNLLQLSKTLDAKSKRQSASSGLK